MLEGEIYQGLAFVSFEEPGGQSSVELIPISLVHLGDSLYELHSDRQQPTRRVVVTPMDRLSIQGQVVSQVAGVTTFRRSGK